MRRTEALQGIRLMKFEEILDRTRSRGLGPVVARDVRVCPAPKTKKP